MENYKLKRVFYKFVITNSNPTTEEPKCGFIDSYNSYDYADFDPTDLTIEESKSKALGYIRWLQLSLALSRFGVFYSNVLKLNGADFKTAPESIEFIFGYNQDESIVCFVDADKYVENDPQVEKLRDGRVIFKGAKALKEIVATVMTQDYSMFVQYYDPEIKPVGKNPSMTPIGFSEEKMVAGKLFEVADIETAKADITVEEITEEVVYGIEEDDVKGK